MRHRRRARAEDRIRGLKDTEMQLGAGMGSFSAGDDAHAGRPAGEGGRQPPRQLANLGTIAGVAIGVNCGPPE